MPSRDPGYAVPADDQQHLDPLVDGGLAGVVRLREVSRGQHVDVVSPGAQHVDGVLEEMPIPAPAGAPTVQDGIPHSALAWSSAVDIHSGSFLRRRRSLKEAMPTAHQ